MNLRSWLRKAPTPHSLRVVTAEGLQDIAVDQSDARKWARAAETIEALAPTRLDALDAKGKLLRSVPLAPVDDDETPAKEAAPTSKLAELAKHLNNAADNSAKHVRESTKEAMDAMVRVCGVAVSSLEKVAGSMDRLSRRLEAAQAAVNAGEAESEDVPSILLRGLVMKQMGPGAAAMMGGMRPGGPASPAGGIPGLPDDLSPEEETELGEMAAGFMARHAARRAAAAPKPNGKGKQ